MDNNTENQLRERIKELESQLAVNQSKFNTISEVFLQYYYSLQNRISFDYETHPVNSIEDYIALGYDAKDYNPVFYEDGGEVYSKRDEEEIFKKTFDSFGELTILFKLGIITDKTLVSQWERYNKLYPSNTIEIQRDGMTLKVDQDFYLENLDQFGDDIDPGQMLNLDEEDD